MKLPIFSSILAIAIHFSLQAADAAKEPAGHVKQSSVAAGSVKSVSPAEFEKLRAQGTNVVLDVRTSKEHAAGHIPNSVNIDVNSPEFEKKVKALDPNKTYLVHCAGGGRGAKACEKLAKLDFLKAYNLEGGMMAWEKAGNKPQR